MPIKKTIEDFVDLRKEQDDLKDAKKAVDKRIEEITTELLGHMDANAITTLRTESGYAISRSIRRYPDITDVQALEDWAMNEGNDYIGEHWGLLQQSHNMKGVDQGIFKQQPNRKLCKVVIDHFANLAQQTGKDINDLIPPGLEMKGTTFLTLRKPKQKDIPNPADALLEMAKAGAAERNK